MKGKQSTWKIFWTISLSLLMASFAAQSEMIDQYQRKKGRQTEFFFEWRDANDEIQSLKFSYDNRRLYSSFRDYRTFRPELVEQYIYKALTQKMKEAPHELKINFTKGTRGLELDVEGRDKNLVKEWKDLLFAEQDKAEQAFLTDTYHMKYKDRFGKTAVKPDHIRFAAESAELLEPVADGIRAAFGDKPISNRALVDYVLGLTQSIPHQHLGNRYHTSGKGYRHPLKVLYELEGDVDSKATLIIALYRVFFPRRGASLFYLPEHALVGFNLPVRDEDEYVDIDGIKYVLGEPSGPKMHVLGSLNERSFEAVASNRSVFEKVPNLR